MVMILDNKIVDVISTLEKAIEESGVWDRERIYTIKLNNNDLLYLDRNARHHASRITPLYSKTRKTINHQLNKYPPSEHRRIADGLRTFSYPLVSAVRVDDRSGFHKCRFLARIFDVETIEMVVNGMIPSDPLEKSREFEVGYYFCDKNHYKIERTLESCKSAARKLEVIKH